MFLWRLIKDRAFDFLVSYKLIRITCYVELPKLSSGEVSSSTPLSKKSTWWSSPRPIKFPLEPSTFSKTASILLLPAKPFPSLSRYIPRDPGKPLTLHWPPYRFSLQPNRQIRSRSRWLLPYSDCSYLSWVGENFHQIQCSCSPKHPTSTSLSKHQQSWARASSHEKIGRGKYF